MVVCVNQRSDPELLEVIDALGSVRGPFCVAERGQKHSRKNCNNGDDNQQFNQRKALCATSEHSKVNRNVRDKTKWHKSQKNETKLGSVARFEPENFSAKEPRRCLVITNCWLGVYVVKRDEKK